MVRLKLTSRYRKGAKYRRLAYELESDAAALRESGFSHEADSVRALASSLGKLGRSLQESGR